MLSRRGKLISMVFGLPGILLTLLVIGELSHLLMKTLLKQQKAWSKSVLCSSILSLESGNVCHVFLRFLPQKRVRSIQTASEQQKPREASLTLLFIIWALWLLVGLQLIEHLGETSLAFIDLIWWYLNASTTTSIDKVPRKGS